MGKFHVNPQTGNAGPCKAKQSCPFGDLEDDHYATREDAARAFEVHMATENAKPKKNYIKYSEKDSRVIAKNIREQAGMMTLMSLGGSDFTAINGGLRFNARILPFNETGERNGRPAKMIVEVKLNTLDYYDVEVHRIRGFNAETHFKAEDVDAHSLSDVLYSLDYDGPTVRNPRV